MGEKMMKSKVFNVEIAGLKLPFEFYTFDYIDTDLKKIFSEELVKTYDMSIWRKWSQIRKDKCEGTEFFTYIKFFVDKETNITYALIGGKTNYNSPDISLHDVIENERRIGRLFMTSDKYKMSNMILVVHHEKASEDSLQATFIERYVQRKYNLFDS